MEWVGTAPFGCDEKCAEGWEEVSRDAWGDGHRCWWGVKRLCKMSKAEAEKEIARQTDRKEKAKQSQTAKPTPPVPAPVPPAPPVPPVPAVKEESNKTVCFAVLSSGRPPRVVSVVVCMVVVQITKPEPTATEKASPLFTDDGGADAV